jgi:hypothetical protein
MVKTGLERESSSFADASRRVLLGAKSQPAGSVD